MAAQPRSAARSNEGRRRLGRARPACGRLPASGGRGSRRLCDRTGAGTHWRTRRRRAAARARGPGRPSSRTAAASPCGRSTARRSSMNSSLVFQPSFSAKRARQPPRAPSLREAARAVERLDRTSSSALATSCGVRPLGSQLRRAPARSRDRPRRRTRSIGMNSSRRWMRSRTSGTSARRYSSREPPRAQPRRASSRRRTSSCMYLLVEPRQLVEVEHRAAERDPVPREHLDHLGERELLAVAAERPAHQCRGS